MKPPARVTSLDLLRDFRAALASFKADGQDALTSNSMDIRRAIDWLTERRQFWTRAVRECQDEVTHAKSELNRKKVLHPGERQPDCTQEIKALKKAQARLEHAENQVEKCKRWEPTLQRAADEYEGPARQLADLLEGDLPKSLSLMDRLVAALEEYVAVAPAPEFTGDVIMTLTTGRANWSTPSRSSPSVGRPPATAGTTRPAAILKRNMLNRSPRKSRLLYGPSTGWRPSCTRCGTSASNPE